MKADKTDEAIAQMAGLVAGVLLFLYIISWLAEQLSSRL